jgi:hypothetical protein
MKPVVKSAFNIDDSELNKLDTVQFPTEMTDAMGELAGVMIKGYAETTGRRYTFPRNNKDESKMSLQIVDVEKKAMPERKIEHDEKTGVYKSNPTGQIVITKAHKSLKATNKLMSYLKEKSK